MLATERLAVYGMRSLSSYFPSAQVRKAGRDRDTVNLGRKRHNLTRFYAWSYNYEKKMHVTSVCMAEMKRSGLWAFFWQ